MKSNDLNKLITAVGPYQAEYAKIVTTEATPLPVNCNLPAALASTVTFPDINSPGTDKLCTPKFVEFPVLPDPYQAPENCPTGITFNPVTVKIFSSLEDLFSNSNVTEAPISVTNNDSLCAFDINLPPVVIPCYPGGPSIGGSASVTVIDQTYNTVDISTLTITSNSACNWTLGGDINITLPKIPCINGLNFVPGVMPITSTCGNLSHYVDNKLVTISKDPATDCKYELKLPALQIPCYPDGPNVYGNITFNITDSVNSTSDTYTAGFIDDSASSCCDFQLGGNIGIDIPCLKTGALISFSNFGIQEPAFRDALSTQLPVTTIPGSSVLITKPNQCSTVVGFPTLPIPCQHGISLGPIHFITIDNFNTGVINLSDDNVTASHTSVGYPGSTVESLRDLTQGCHWSGTTITLPFPNCSAGMDFTADGFTVKLNDSVAVPNVTSSVTTNSTRYNTLKFQAKPVSSDPTHQHCGFDLVGELNLGLADFAFKCNSLTLGTNSSVNLTMGADPLSTASAAIGLQKSNDSCGFEFSTNTLALPVLACPTGYNPPKISQLYVQTSDGTRVEQTGLSFGTQSGVASSACGFSLTGTLNVPTSSGTGGFGAPWTPYDSFNAGDTCLLVYPEGGVCGYRAGAAISVGPGLGQVTICPTPGAPSGGNWQKQTSDEDGVKMKPFKVYRCAEDMTARFQHYADQNTTNVTQLVKVFHDSQLSGSFQNASTTYIYGLDTPFILNPGEIVYLETVFTTSNTGVITPLYAAIGHGTEWDVDGTDSDGNLLSGVALNAPSPTKVITPSQASGLYDNSTYTNRTVNQYVGLSSIEYLWLISQQNSAIAALAALTDSVPRQFKAWRIIARARAASPPTAHFVTPGELILGPDNQSFIVDQLLFNHLELSLRSNNNTPVLVPMVTSEVNVSKTKIATPILKSITNLEPGNPLFANSFILMFDDNHFETAPNLPSTVFDRQQINLLVNAETSLGLHIYYTTDGTVPTVNTIKNLKCHRYVPGVGVVVNTNGGVTNAVQWFAVNQAFDCSEIGVLKLADIHT